MSTSGLVEPQKSGRAAAPTTPRRMPSLIEATLAVKRDRRSSLRRTCRLVRLDGTCGSVRSRRVAARGVGELVEFDEVGGREDEHLAHHVRVLLVAAHKADHPTAGRALDHGLEAIAHQVLELHALPNDRRAPPPLQERLLDAREPPAEHAYNQVVLVVGLRA